MSKSEDKGLEAQDGVRKAKVLIADDDVNIRLLMSQTLSKIGLEVFEAENGAEAVELFREHRPSLVLLDVNMPLLNGYETCRAIRADRRGDVVPIMIITNADDTASINAAFDAGATEFLAKPIAWPIFGQRVRYILRASHAFAAVVRQEERLKHLETFDRLTGLPNRHSFNDQLQRVLRSAEQSGRYASVVVVNLDKFKRINDARGQSYGDLLLKEVARRLSLEVRQIDMLTRMSGREDHDTGLARVGGDEFTIVLSDIKELADIANVAGRVVESVSAPINIGKYQHVVTPSLGISVYPKDGGDADTLLKRAEVALDFAKEINRGSFVFYRDSMDERAQDMLDLEQDLRNALERNQLRLFYQPQIDVKSRSLVSVEALLRWQHPDRGMVPPDQFIRVAEETGEIVSIGDWVALEACRQAVAWVSRGLPPIRMAVNLSTVQFQDEGLPERIGEVLRETDLPPEYLELELTESVIMSDANSSVSKLEDLKGLGVALAVDDFGTGYSSLSYLKQFPIDTLKIDQSFVRGVPEGKDDSAIVSAIISMANAMDLDTIAEGVEGQDQLRFLAGHGCDYIQGYFFSKPVASEALPELVTKDYWKYFEP